MLHQICNSTPTSYLSWRIYLLLLKKTSQVQAYLFVLWAPFLSFGFLFSHEHSWDCRHQGVFVICPQGLWQTKIDVFMCAAFPFPAFPTYGKPNPSACPDVWGHTLQETKRQNFCVTWDLSFLWGLSFLFWVKGWFILPASLPLLRMPGAKELYFCCADQVCLFSCGLFLYNSSFHGLEKLWREWRDCK